MCLDWFNPSSILAPGGGSPAGYVFPGATFSALQRRNPQVLTPQTFRSVFKIPSDLTGRGQTIDVIALGNTFSQAPLTHFDARFGLPNAQVSVLSAAPLHGTAKVSSETMLDVEWIHTLAPQARINVIIYPPTTSLIAQTKPTSISVTASANNISANLAEIRLGLPTSWESLVSYATFAAAGDGGPQHVTLPPFLPGITSVGGVQESPTGLDWWPDGGTGAADWAVPKPAWEAGTPTRWLVTPDVSWLAGYPGVAVYTRGWSAISGTSVAAPLWSALWALVQESRQTAGKSPLVGMPAAILFSVASKHPDAFVQSGGLKGWQWGTGLGAPNVPQLLSALDALPNRCCTIADVTHGYGLLGWWVGVGVVVGTYLLAILLDMAWWASDRKEVKIGVLVLGVLYGPMLVVGLLTASGVGADGQPRLQRLLLMTSAAVAIVVPLARPLCERWLRRPRRAVIRSRRHTAAPPGL